MLEFPYCGAHRVLDLVEYSCTGICRMREQTFRLSWLDPSPTFGNHALTGSLRQDPFQ